MAALRTQEIFLIADAVGSQGSDPDGQIEEAYKGPSLAWSTDTVTRKYLPVALWVLQRPGECRSLLGVNSLPPAATRTTIPIWGDAKV